jgi:hypothetical protein
VLFNEVLKCGEEKQFSSALGSRSWKYDNTHGTWSECTAIAVTAHVLLGVPRQLYELHLFPHILA